MFGERLVGAFGEMKALFDPDNRMNPGKVAAPRAIDDNLRLGAHWRPEIAQDPLRLPQDDHSFTRQCCGASASVTAVPSKAG